MNAYDESTRLFEVRKERKAKERKAKDERLKGASLFDSAAASPPPRQEEQKP